MIHINIGQEQKKIQESLWKLPRSNTEENDNDPLANFIEIPNDILETKKRNEGLPSAKI